MPDRDEQAVILTALNDPSTHARCNALRHIRDLPGDQSAYRDGIIAALADPAWVVREAAIHVASPCSDPDGLIHRSLVALSLADSKPLVRHAASVAVGPRIEPERDYGVAIRHRFERQRMRAALALAHTAPERLPEAIPLLRVVIADSHVKVRLAALQATAILPRASQRVLLPVVCRKCFEANAVVSTLARNIWNEVLRPELTDDPLSPLQPFVANANIIALQTAMESLPSTHPLQMTWSSIVESKSDLHRFAKLLAQLCERVLIAEGMS